MRAPPSRLAGWLCAGALAALVGVIPNSAAASRHAATGDCPAAPRTAQEVAPGSGRTVALTFDDGPGASTRQILALLAREQVTATFFNLGDNEASAPAIVRREARSGYLLGDHTWDHADLTTLDAAGQAREIDRERARQARITGHLSCFFRPPYGSYDATTVDVARARHLAIWVWSVDPEDWKADGSAAPFWVHRITQRAEAGGAQRHPVILFHNQPAGNPATVSALPKVIHFYKTRGYTFVDLLGDTGPPEVHAVHAALGSTAGGERVVVRGVNFRDVTAVRFDRELAPHVQVLSPRKLIATVPKRHRGLVDVSVATADHGRSATTPADKFRYVAPPTITAVRPAHGPTAGGQQVRIVGANFYDVRAVHLGRMVLQPVHRLGPDRLQVTTPPHKHPGTLDVVVRTAFGSTPVRRADQYTYDAPSSPTS
jgi:peptidoglycan/xylan/chitin deacetylase (PgdA/CDA1 family)